MGEKNNEKKNPCREPMYLREKEYFALLRGELERRKGENVDITFRQVRKNNGVCRNACTVRYDEAQIAPTIYLDPYYDHYLHGEAVAESAESILRYCKHKTPEVRFPEDFFQKYDHVPARLGIKLIGTTRNRDFLEDVPHIDM